MAWPRSKPNQTQTTADLILSSASAKGRAAFLVRRIEMDSLQFTGEHGDAKSFTGLSLTLGQTLGAMRRYAMLRQVALSHMTEVEKSCPLGLMESFCFLAP